MKLLRNLTVGCICLFAALPVQADNVNQLLLGEIQDTMNTGFLYHIDRRMFAEQGVVAEVMTLHADTLVSLSFITGTAAQGPNAGKLFCLFIESENFQDTLTHYHDTECDGEINLVRNKPRR